MAGQNELLFAHGINFNDLPGWQKRGVGLYWETHEHLGVDPTTGRRATATRRWIRREMSLPMRDVYEAFVRSRLAAAGEHSPEGRGNAGNEEA